MIENGVSHGIPKKVKGPKPRERTPRELSWINNVSTAICKHHRHEDSFHYGRHTRVAWSKKSQKAKPIPTHTQTDGGISIDRHMRQPSTIPLTKVESFTIHFEMIFCVIQMGADLFIREDTVRPFCITIISYYLSWMLFHADQLSVCGRCGWANGVNLHNAFQDNVFMSEFHGRDELVVHTQRLDDGMEMGNS